MWPSTSRLREKGSDLRYMISCPPPHLVVQSDDIVLIVDKHKILDSDESLQHSETPSLMDSMRVYKEGVEQKRAEREHLSPIIMKPHEVFKYEEDQVPTCLCG